MVDLIRKNTYSFIYKDCKYIEIRGAHEIFVHMAVTGLTLVQSPSVQPQSWSQTADQPDDLLSSEFHRERREALRARMPDNSVAVIFANPVRNRANDVNYVYHQDPNFYYLTGLREPHAALLLFKEAQRINGKKVDEIRLRAAAQCPGRTVQRPAVRKRRRQKIGLDAVLESPDFKKLRIDFSKFDKVLFYDFQGDVRDTKEEGDLYDLIETFKRKANYPHRPEPFACTRTSA